jgi:hypothetical protein
MHVSSTEGIKESQKQLLGRSYAVSSSSWRASIPCSSNSSSKKQASSNYESTVAAAFQQTYKTCRCSRCCFTTCRMEPAGGALAATTEQHLGPKPVTGSVRAAQQCKHMRAQLHSPTVLLCWLFSFC